MSNYVQSTNFATKDALSSGDPLKIVKGTEINTEFNNIATAVATKADLATPTFTGSITLGSSLLTVPTGSAPSYTCRAWVNFDGTTPDPSTIRGSGNVTSITKNETGVYIVNLTTAMPDANFSAVAVASGTGGAAFRIVTVSQYETDEVVIRSADVPSAAGTYPVPQDAGTISLAIFR